MRLRSRSTWLMGLPAVALAALLVVQVSASAAATGQGAGIWSEQVTWAGAGMPAAATEPACIATSFSMSGDSSITFEEEDTSSGVTLESYSGPLHIAASGATNCAQFALEAGSLSNITMASVPPSAISCSNATAVYVRSAYLIRVQGSATCQFSFDTPISSTVQFTLDGVLVPTQGNGVTTNVGAASISGAVVITS